MAKIKILKQYIQILIIILLITVSQSFIQSDTGFTFLYHSEFMDDDFEINLSNSSTMGWTFQKTTETSLDLPETLYYDCGSQPGHRLFGGYQIFTGDNSYNQCHGRSYEIIKTLLEIPNHYEVSIAFKLFKIDGWKENQVILTINTFQYFVGSWKSCDGFVDRCGTQQPPSIQERQEKPGFNEYVSDYSITRPDQNNDLVFSIKSNLSNCQDQSFGIRELKVLIATCHVSCYKCSGPEKTDCLECYDNADFTEQGIDDNSNPIGTCTCKPSFNFNPGNPLEFYPQDTLYKCQASNTCVEGSFQNQGNECEFCNKNKCYQCTGNKDNCTECINNRFNLPDCDGECESNCSSCKDDNGRCVVCKDGYFLTQTSTCIKCSKPCDKCSTSDSSKCLSCINQYYLESGTNQCVRCKSQNCEICIDDKVYNCKFCQLGYYFDQKVKKCVQHCSSDYPIKNFEKRICVEICPIGYFHSSYENICRKCHENCKECTGPNENQCIQCEGVQYYDYLKDQCVVQCENTQYKDMLTKSCLQKIISPYDDNCPISCEKGFYYNHETYSCKQCELNCLYCDILDQYTCYKCQDGYYKDSKNSCVKQCPNGQFNNQTTRECDIQYDKENFLNRNTYLDIDQKTIKQCHISCPKCKDNKPCCQMDMTTYTCISINTNLCPWNSYACLTCFYSCETCFGSAYNECLTCTENRGDKEQKAINGICECNDNFNAEIDKVCVEQSFFNINTTIYILIICTFLAQLFVGLINKKFIFIFYFIDSMQNLSFLIYINMYHNKQIIDLLKFLYMANFQNLIPNVFYNFFQSITPDVTYNSFSLWSVYDQDYQSRIQNQGKSASFIMNIGSIVIQFIIIKVLGYLFAYIYKKKQIKYQSDLVKLPSNSSNDQFVKSEGLLLSLGRNMIDEQDKTNPIFQFQQKLTMILVYLYSTELALYVILQGYTLSFKNGIYIFSYIIAALFVVYASQFIIDHIQVLDFFSVKGKIVQLEFINDAVVDKRIMNNIRNTIEKDVYAQDQRFQTKNTTIGDGDSIESYRQYQREQNVLKTMDPMERENFQKLKKKKFKEVQKQNNLSFSNVLVRLLIRKIILSLGLILFNDQIGLQGYTVFLLLMYYYLFHMVDFLFVQKFFRILFTVNEIAIFFIYLMYGICASKLGWDEFSYEKNEIILLQQGVLMIVLLHFGFIVSILFLENNLTKRNLRQIFGQKRYKKVTVIKTNQKSDCGQFIEEKSKQDIIYQTVDKKTQVLHTKM